MTGLPTSPLLRHAAPVLARIGVVVGLHLLAVGHDAPGGGFVAGLVIGASLTLYRLASGRTVANPVVRDPRRILGAGVVTVGAVVLAPAVLGSGVARMSAWKVDLGWVGSFKATGALAFDVGVLLIVVGLVLTVLDATLDEEVPA